VGRQYYYTAKEKKSSRRHRNFGKQKPILIDSGSEVIESIDEAADIYPIRRAGAGMA
jgi:hypothetical protein